MKKSMIMLQVLILMVCFSFLMLAGCDNDHHGRREMRTRQPAWEVHRSQDKWDRRDDYDRHERRPGKKRDERRRSKKDKRHR